MGSMKKAIFSAITISLISTLSISADKSEILLDDPEPRLPQRESSKSEDTELMLDRGNATHQSIEGRQVKENQEEIDPIFYDATTSPAEMKMAD